jgi:hypothetical protein
VPRPHRSDRSARSPTHTKPVQGQLRQRLLATARQGRRKALPSLLENQYLVVQLSDNHLAQRYTSTDVRHTRHTVSCENLSARTLFTMLRGEEVVQFSCITNSDNGEGPDSRPPSMLGGRDDTIGHASRLQDTTEVQTPPGRSRLGRTLTQSPMSISAVTRRTFAPCVGYWAARRSTPAFISSFTYSTCARFSNLPSSSRRCL